MSLKTNYPNFVKCTPIYFYFEEIQKTIACKNCSTFPSYTITDDPNNVRIQCIECGFTEVTPIKSFVNFLNSFNLCTDKTYSINFEKWVIKSYKDFKQLENYSLCETHNKAEQYL